MMKCMCRLLGEHTRWCARLVPVLGIHCASQLVVLEAHSLAGMDSVCPLNSRQVGGEMDEQYDRV
jgi:hypothetical protein